MAEHRAVLLLTVCEPEHPSHVGLDLFEIRIELITAQSPVIQILVGRLYDLPDLLIGRNAAHHGKHLPREHHGGRTVLRAVCLEGIPAVVVIAVEPRISVLIGKPLTCAYPVRYRRSLEFQIPGDLRQRKHGSAA